MPSVFPITCRKFRSVEKKGWVYGGGGGGGNMR